MRKFLIAAVLAPLAFALPAGAGTIDEIVAHGMVLTIQGMDIDVTYTPDGKFTAMDGQITGTWKKDGDRMCTTSNFQPDESCTAYPADKKSGDSFEITSPQGSATIKIK